MRRSFRVPKKPIAGRCFGGVRVAVLALVGLLSTVATAAPSHVLTEAEVIERALENPGLRDLLQAREYAADARLREAGRWANPQLSYTREQTLGSSAVGEDYVGLSQAIDISGRRFMARKAAAKRAEAFGDRNENTRAEQVGAVRTAYATTLWAQEQVALLESWHGRVRQSVGIAQDRVDAGDAPRLHVERVRRELQLLDAQVALAQGARALAWSELRALLDDETRVKAPLLAGPLLPDQADRGGDMAQAPTLRALSNEFEAAQGDVRAGRRAAVPPLTLSLGYKGVEQGAAGPRQHGFTAGASIAIPIADRGQVQRRDAQAKLAAARGSASLERARLESLDAGLHARQEALRAGLTRAQDAADLSTMAEHAYRGGEIGAMELLDAHRSAFESERAAMDLALEIRLVRIERDRLLGRTQP